MNIWCNVYAFYTHVIDNDVMMFYADCRAENFSLTCSHWMQLWRPIYTQQWNQRYRSDQS